MTSVNLPKVKFISAGAAVHTAGLIRFRWHGSTASALIPSATPTTLAAIWSLTDATSLQSAMQKLNVIQGLVRTNLLRETTCCPTSRQPSVAKSRAPNDCGSTLIGQCLATNNCWPTLIGRLAAPLVVQSLMRDARMPAFQMTDSLRVWE